MRVIPAVFTWCWAGETDTPASVLIGALRTMSATLVPETVEKGSLKIFHWFVSLTRLHVLRNNNPWQLAKYFSSVELLIGQ